MRELPTGTVTLLFTDIEGSTRLLQQLGRERYVEALTSHRGLLRDAFVRHGGVEVEMQGDSFHFAFVSARAAVCAAAAGQRALAEYEWPSEPIRVRIGVHSGEPLEADGLYAGLDVHRAARVMSVAHGGQVLLSQATRELVGDEELPGLGFRDLGEHRLKDLLEPQRLCELVVEGLERDFPPLRTLNQTNLPVAANPLLGRERELDELTGLLRDGARLVTITGAGGTGKTRLALQVAAELVEGYEGGVFWVPLAGLRDPELVLSSIAQTIGAAGDLYAHLRGRETLVLLDNFEHLLPAVSALGELLAGASSLRTLVTSRSRLNLDAEHEYPLDSLPDAGALELFLERARQAGARLEPSETVRAICRRVDNLPLAVELAAGRARLLGPEALLGRLERRLPVLTGGRRDLPERQRTLLAAIEWSHDLLDEDAKQLFAHLSVFAGSFSLEAAEAICDAPLDTLATLAEFSLLKPSGDGRFLMLETIREYARDRLGEDPAAEELHERHAQWFLALAEDTEERIYAPGQAALFERLDHEHDNFRAALDWLRGQRTPILELRLAAALQDFWIARGHVDEGRARLESALADGPSGVPAAVRAKALDGAAWLATAQHDYETAERFATESLGLARSLDDPRRIVSALSTLGAAEVHRGRYPHARELYDDALTRARAAHDEPWVTIVLGQLSDLALYEGAFDDVDLFATECFERASGGGDVWTMSISVANLGLSALHRGEMRAAAAHLVRSLDLGLEVGARYVVGIALDSIAALTAPSNATAAARLAGTAQEIRRASGSVLPPFEARMHAATIELLEERLGGGALTRLLREGAAMTLEAAAELGRELASREAPPAAADPATP